MSTYINVSRFNIDIGIDIEDVTTYIGIYISIMGILICTSWLCSNNNAAHMEEDTNSDDTSSDDTNSISTEDDQSNSDNASSDHVDSNDADDEYVEEDPDILGLIADRALDEAKLAECIAAELQKELEKADALATATAKKAIAAINAAEASVLQNRNRNRNRNRNHS